MASPGTIQYTARDFDSIKEALRVHLVTKFPNTWRDFYESNTGQAWLELVAYSYTILSFYLDYQANESYLPTAADRENVVRICKLIGYQLQSPVGASVQCTLTLAATQVNDVIIPVGTQVTSAGGLVYEFLTEGRITAGSLTGSATVTQGQARVDVFTSDGTTFQAFLLTGTPVIYQSIVVAVDGTTWTESESLVYGDSTSQVFAVTYAVDSDGNDVAYVEFGDGTSGVIPPAGSTITVTYRTGGGIQGNIGLNQISADIDGILDGVVPTTTVAVAVTNPIYRGSGGEDRETVDHAKYWAPMWVRANGRAVTEQDFDTLATRFVDSTYGSLAYAKARLYQEIPELNQVNCAVWSRDNDGDPTTASAGLKAALQDYFDNNGAGAIRLICADTVVEDGTNLYIDIYVRVSPESNYAEADVIQNVRTAILELFASTTIQPGQDFWLSSLYRAIQGAAGVEYALIQWIKAGLQLQQTLGAGNAVLTTFAGTLGRPSPGTGPTAPGVPDVSETTPVLESSIVVQAGAQSLTDDGAGVLTGDGTGTINYTTGVISVTFTTPPAVGESVVCTYRYLKPYQRGEAESTVTALATRFTGSIGYAPIVPGSFALSDGTQVAVDDGSGNLTGDVDASGNNTIDYATGSYDVTFTVAVAVGLSISSTYRQYLNVNSSDIPVIKSELPVRGTLTIETI